MRWFRFFIFHFVEHGGVYAFWFHYLDISVGWFDYIIIRFFCVFSFTLSNPLCICKYYNIYILFVRFVI